MPERTTVAGPVSEVLPTSIDGLLVRAGEVAGEPQDDGREHDADDHGERGEQARVGVADLVDQCRVDTLEVGERARQVGARGDARRRWPTTTAEM